ncbi:hypothetical protein P153DRAFT_222286 [Dothidotthia symphoricarpi CBS 119687]|uniref:Uncharacterized protein n=1 Tax=Dothidotthia symphoricarpi CBS 119687 TaxID=1392245 RepID=A0A6A6AHB7_9PLEO|nr:uncharacterized protein P153DRAFT_222286 [Dothidotthia symphoricarpi CBS 119687]KAF2130643.1 hypothetical protein P153DRAFT_222286 [Dothidotthia symphoricarpi CBS 119687]
MADCTTEMISLPAENELGEYWHVTASRPLPNYIPAATKTSPPANKTPSPVSANTPDLTTLPPLPPPTDAEPWDLDEPFTPVAFDPIWDGPATHLFTATYLGRTVTRTEAQRSLLFLRHLRRLLHDQLDLIDECGQDELSAEHDITSPTADQCSFQFNHIGIAEVLNPDSRSCWFERFGLCAPDEVRVVRNWFCHEFATPVRSRSLEAVMRGGWGMYASLWGSVDAVVEGLERLVGDGEAWREPEGAARGWEPQGGGDVEGDECEAGVVLADDRVWAVVLCLVACFVSVLCGPLSVRVVVSRFS